jgi:hypothetical protein
LRKRGRGEEAKDQESGRKFHNVFGLHD